MKKYLLLLSLLFLASFAGCKTSASVKYQMPSPEPELAIIYGALVSPENEPVKDLTVRLAQVYRFEDEEEGTFILDDAKSPSATSDDQGNYMFLNIAPGEYVLFIGSIHSDYKIASEAKDTPIIYEVGPGEKLRIDPMIIDFN